jgi:Uma2 family endonuclease
MATAVKKPEDARARPLEDDQWVVIPATWAAYRSLARAKGERSNPRYIYRDGRLTIVSPGVTHEVLKSNIVLLLELILMELRIRRLPTGSVTLRERDAKGRLKSGGVEGDASFYLTNIEKVRGKKTLVMGVDPPPDLAVEVVVSHDVGDALDVYASYRVREVWVCRRSSLTFVVLGPDQQYAESASSACLPFLTSVELSSWLFRGDYSDDVDLLHTFREWVRNTLAPRREAGGGG